MIPYAIPGALICPSPSENDTPTRPYQKYVERGWRMVDDGDPERFSEASFATGWRWIDARMSWVVQLPTDGLIHPSSRPLHPDPVTITNWDLSGHKPAQMSTALFSDPCFRHTYVLQSYCFADSRIVGDRKLGLPEAIIRVLRHIKKDISKRKSQTLEPGLHSSSPIQLIEAEYVA
ncbi:hypothetical protein BV25DRAFT_783397 [Artomyces pyxidatus]|uniref:Uncharacterized protein n=1 Tax=Artomyces pyxidatus TaxID=48021 RepID=A0ACB8SZ58_9AGAM|nr:hypothetical protein BV25DRAFT_783397 [Artomyces pyxidatus]